MCSRTSRIVIPVAAALTLLVSTQPARAASSICRYVNTPLTDGACQTAEISANRSGHHIYVRVSPHTTWSVIDQETRKKVGGGTSGASTKHKTIFGLYGDRYRLEVNGAFAGYGYINNN